MGRRAFIGAIPDKEFPNPSHYCMTLCLLSHLPYCLPFFKRHIASKFTKRMRPFVFLTSSAVLYSMAVFAGTTPTSSCGAPSAVTLNGTFSGYHNPFYNEDFFLGIPFARPPTGNLRYAAPQSLNTSWTGVKNATEYGYECVGYGVIPLFLSGSRICLIRVTA